MNTTKLNNAIDCTNLSSSDIDFQIKQLIFNSYKHVVLKNAYGKVGLLSDVRGNVKVEIISDAGSNFANNTDGLKVVVNGNVGDNSACDIKSGKFTILGSTGACFGNNIQSGEFYIFENCGSNCFLNLTNAAKVVIGGQIGSNFATRNNGGTIVVLNLQGGNIFLEDNFIKDVKCGFIYIRSDKGKIRTMNNRFLIETTTETDEDIYLPLISEFARLFNYSLSKIKSKPFYKIGISK